MDVAPLEKKMINLIPMVWGCAPLKASVKEVDHMVFSLMKKGKKKPKKTFEDVIKKILWLNVIEPRVRRVKEQARSNPKYSVYSRKPRQMMREG